ncbi:TonB-dependent receptor plug domain-containing protein [Sphingomonas alpina]|uniref:TonB-dependent receptor plug domain-containing protein n=1 Tax=Sphingomonas alpina TaxID=653931 RepID=A0A7H0LKW9_9SPHN|nr:TonB-dependent receptor plug domain-containing protein [Sphingomonas alpina]QNQ10322.1 TonB-dependent receptor plug domain-containing protein [Sphingomonas alpina]
MPADTPAPAPDDSDIIVIGRASHRIGAARSASEGVIGGEDLRIRPLLRTSELAEAVPGLIAVQHSGGGKAAQYLIRGYNLDHGTDFSIAIDTMPFNLRSQAHGQGYLDLNGLIPETIDRIEYRKGPYRAADGDFSAVAAASLRTLDRFERPFASVTAGSYGYRRIAAGGIGRTRAGNAAARRRIAGE